MMRRWLFACLLLLLATAAVAQENGTAVDYTEWTSLATRAESAVEAGRASDTAFIQLRGEIDGFRQRLQEQLTANQSRLRTLEDQIAALGPPPEEGATEAREIAERREALGAQLERLTTPRRTAEEAFRRANGIIIEIDAILRQRQAEKLLNSGPTPLNPAIWDDAYEDLADTFTAVVAGVRTSFAAPTKIEAARDNLPVILLLIAIGSFLLYRGRDWSERIALRIQQRRESSSNELAAFCVSLGQVLFPVLGAAAIILALARTELYGPRGAILVYAVIPSVILIFGARWLGGRIFPKATVSRPHLRLPPEKLRTGRAIVTLLGIVLALRMIVMRLDAYERYDIGSDAVLFFPLLILGGLGLFLLGRLLRQHRPDAETTTGEQAVRARAVRGLGRALQVVGVIGPLLAAAGYSVAGAALVFPSILTIALMGLIAVIQKVIRNLYSWIMPGDSEEDALIPTLLGFMLVLASLPIVALFWGARVTDLTELYSRLRAGIVIGDTIISPGALITLLVVFGLGYLITRAVQGTLRTSVLPKTRLDPGGQSALVSGIGYVGIFLSALVAITSAGLDLSGLAIVAGALSVGIGFGLQTIVSNFVSGIILLIERPISEGDWIEVAGHQGYVRKVAVRSTRIETFDRSDVIVPNSDLISGTVTNFTRGNTVGRAIVQVGVAYGTDTRRVEKILREIAEAHPMVLAIPAPSIVFAGFGASSLDFEIRAILRDVNFMLSVKTEIHHQIAERFVAENIEIPFAQTDIWLRNPETLPGQGKPQSD